MTMISEKALTPEIILGLASFLRTWHFPSPLMVNFAWDSLLTGLSQLSKTDACNPVCIFIIIMLWYWALSKLIIKQKLGKTHWLPVKWPSQWYYSECSIITKIARKVYSHLSFDTETLFYGHFVWIGTKKLYKCQLFGPKNNAW